MPNTRSEVALAALGGSLPVVFCLGGVMGDQGVLPGSISALARGKKGDPFAPHT